MMHPPDGEDLSRPTSFVRAPHSGHTHILAIIPAFEEERLIGSVVLQTKPYVDEVLVVDDGSHDDTARIAHAAGARVIRHDRNEGKGSALNTGLVHARQLGATAVVLIDGDGQHRAEEIPIVLGPVLCGEADVVVGSRYLQPQAHVPRHRMLGHKALNWLTGIVSGVHLSDSQNGFRALSCRALNAFRFCSQGFSVESEMQFLIREHGLCFVEAPVTTLYCDKPKRSAVVQGVQVVDGTLHGAGYYRPFQVLEGPGAGLFVLGLAIRVATLESLQLSSPLVSILAALDIPMMFLGTYMLFAGVVLSVSRPRTRGGLNSRHLAEVEPEHDDDNE